MNDVPNFPSVINDGIRKQAEDLILAVAAKWGCVAFAIDYADGNYGMEVYPNGTIKTMGYATEYFGETMTVPVRALPWKDLGYLLDSLKIYGIDFN